MSGGVPYAGGPYASGRMVTADIPANATPTLAVEVAFATNALDANPAWVDITPDVREWDVTRGRSRELERMQPGRATVTLSNLQRQYDSQNAAGPWFGKLKPMRRIRIRETLNGVTYPTFDGFIDSWNLDYPATGKDATATVVATDGFKLFGRNDLPGSVYEDTVRSDGPAIWWRFDDPQYLFQATDSSGNNRSGTPEGKVKFQGQGLIVKDPGNSLELVEAANTNVETSFAVDATQPFSFEFWFTWLEQPAFIQKLVDLQSGATAAINFQINNTTSKGAFVYNNNAGGAFSAQLSTAFVLGTRYHIMCVHDAARKLHIYVNGAEGPYSVQDTTTGATNTSFVAVGSSDAQAATRALIDEFAFYSSALTGTQALNHYNQGTTPWVGDFASGRIRRILALMSWPSLNNTGLEEIDDGQTSLQSAALGTKALEHMQKAAESEFGSLFMTRDGKVRFIDRYHIFNRLPRADVYGDGVGEVGYRGITFLDGEAVIRNRATVSRLNGVARTEEDAASKTEFGRFDYTLDGLLHQSDSYSDSLAGLIVTEYKDPRRRVTSLTFGPGGSTLWAPVLAPELGDAITVRNRPPGGGALFEQVCVVEGIRDSGAPGGRRIRTLILSPELEATMALGTLGYAQVVAAQGGITTAVDLTNLSVTVTVAASRRIRVSSRVIFRSTIADDVAGLRIQEGAAILQDTPMLCRPATIDIGADSDVILTPTAGSHTYKLVAARTTGTGTITMDAGTTFPAYILVEDIGPDI